MSPASTSVEVEVGGRQLKLSNFDKVLYPEAGFTKGQVIDYYTRIAPVLLPHLHDRPLNLYRSPNGVDKPGFWHKEVPDHAPDWLTRWHNTEADEDETQCYAVLDSTPALVWMANFAGIELDEHYLKEAIARGETPGERQVLQRALASVHASSPAARCVDCSRRSWSSTCASCPAWSS